MLNVNFAGKMCADFLPLIRAHIRQCEQCRKGVEQIHASSPLIGMMIPKKTLIDFLTKEDTDHGQDKEIG